MLSKIIEAFKYTKFMYKMLHMKNNSIKYYNMHEPLYINGNSGIMRHSDTHKASYSYTNIGNIQTAVEKY